MTAMIIAWTFLLITAICFIIILSISIILFARKNKGRKYSKKMLSTSPSINSVVDKEIERAAMQMMIQNEKNIG